nr:hypothetical protein [Tanacetum cinerariifolium]
MVLFYFLKGHCELHDGLILLLGDYEFHNGLLCSQTFIRVSSLVDKPSTLFLLISYPAPPPARFRPPAAALHHQPRGHHHDATATAASSSPHHHCNHPHLTSLIVAATPLPNLPLSSPRHHFHPHIIPIAIVAHLHRTPPSPPRSPATRQGASGLSVAPSKGECGFDKNTTRVRLVRHLHRLGAFGLTLTAVGAFGLCREQLGKHPRYVFGLADSPQKGAFGLHSRTRVRLVWQIRHKRVRLVHAAAPKRNA